MNSMDLPIACSLTEEELRQRRQVIIDSFRAAAVSITELPDGYAYAFAPTSEGLMQVAQLVDMERQCCAFLTFRIVVDPGSAAMRLEVTGPKEAKAVIADFFSPK